MGTFRAWSVLLQAVAAAGCGICGGARPGFRFEWVQPPTVRQTTEFVCESGAPTMRANPLGAIALPPTEESVSSHFFTGRQLGVVLPQPAEAGPVVSQVAPSPKLTCQEWCELLAEVYRQRQAGTLPKRMTGAPELNQ